MCGLSFPGTLRRDGPVQASRSHQDRPASGVRGRLRGLSGHRDTVAPPTDLSRVRPRRLLRQLPGAPHHRPRQRQRSSGHPFARTGGVDFRSGCDGPGFGDSAGSRWPPFLQFAVDEGGASPHQWPSSGPAMRCQRAWRRQQLVGHGQAALREPAPRVTLVLRRTVEKVDSIGLLVRRCTQCSLGSHRRRAGCRARPLPWRWPWEAGEGVGEGLGGSQGLRAAAGIVDGLDSGFGL